MNKNIAVAVIGTGKWGQNLVKTFAELGVLAAITDCDEVLGRTLAKHYNVDFYSDLAALLQSNIAAVAIATPVFSHFDIAKQALLANKDVFVEKPMTMEVAQAEQLIRLAAEKSAICMVGHLLLYQPAVQFIKDFLAAGKLGKIYSFRQTRRSLGTIRKQENVLYSFGVHDLAVLDYLVAEPVNTILGVSQTIISAGIEDEMSLHLRYPSGIQAHLCLSWLWPIKERNLMVLGERGALRFDELTQQVIYYQNYGNPDSSITQKGHEVVFEDATAPLKLELQHFLDCVATRKTPRSDALQGKEVVKLMADIMKVQEKANEYRLSRT
jgi:predicted dehydrogenase